jgi:hypothetical protein
MEVANTLAYYNVAKVMAVRCFIVQIDLCVLKTLHGSMHEMEGLAYIVGPVSYILKMFVKLTPE